MTNPACPAPCCPVCFGQNLDALTTATGSFGYCRACFHGFRLTEPDYSYAANAMCGLGTSAERLASQCRFVAPFVGNAAHVLEIGCATGELAQVLQSRLPIARYEAIELSSAGQTAASRMARLHTQPLRDLLAAGAIAPASFDAVVMSHVLEHIGQIAEEVAAIALVLKPGGSVFLEVPHGSGHLALPVDDNVSHLHFFSIASLTRLLAGAGLDVVSVELGARLDARYADSLRVMARPFAAPVLANLDLALAPALATPGLIVWGAGSLATELLGNYLEPSRIALFIDRNPAKHGTTLLGRPVHGPEALLGAAPATILINSIDFAPAIEADIAALLPGHSHHLVRIGDVLDHFRGSKRQPA